MQQLQMVWNEIQAVFNVLNIVQSTMPNANSLEEQQVLWPIYGGDEDPVGRKSDQPYENL